MLTEKVCGPFARDGGQGGLLPRRNEGQDGGLVEKDGGDIKNTFTPSVITSILDIQNIY
jgi:hypothetical protein